MGRVKLQIKKIENITNRQVTYSKRRNGLIKKAYELSVLCDVDVALLMFSPSGRATVFSGNNNKSVEEILARYVNLPEHERGRKLQNQEHLQSALSKMKRELADKRHHPTSQVSAEVQAEVQAEEIQQEFLRCNIQLEDMEKRLRVFEGDPSEITTLIEAQHQEHILEDTLKSVRRRKQVLEENYDFCKTRSSSKDYENGIIARDPKHNLDWLQPRDAQVQIMNFLDSNGLLPLRGHRNGVDSTQLPATIFFHEPNIQMDDQTSPSSGMEDEENTKQPHLVQPMEVNHSPWTEFYQIGNETVSAAPPRERTLLELFLSRLTP